MAVPTIDSVSPSSGHTGGKTLIEIAGTGFALPAAPPATGVTTAPQPSVRVLVGGLPCPAVWVLSSTSLRALTPIHDPSGIPATDTAAAVPASDVTVLNLDASGDPISGETVTRSASFSFHRPTFDSATTKSVAQIAVESLMTELQRQVHPNVQFQPHTDYDPDTGDGLNICDFATLPGIALMGLRLPTSKDIASREAPEIDIGGGLVAVRRPPVVRDVLLTLTVVSDSTSELLWLESVIKQVMAKNPSLRAQQAGAVLTDTSGAEVTWQIDYQRGDAVTFNDRSAGVEWFTAEIAIRRAQETDIPGVSTVGTSLGAHEATVELAYKADAFNVGTQGGVD